MARHKGKSHGARKASKRAGRKVNVGARAKKCKGLTKGKFRTCMSTGKRPKR